MSRRQWGQHKPLFPSAIGINNGAFAFTDYIVYHIQASGLIGSPRSKDAQAAHIVFIGHHRRLSLRNEAQLGRIENADPVFFD